jgi:hypothetical protein
MIDIFGEGPGDRVKAAKEMVGTAYKQENNSTLRTANSSAALQYMDCAEFVCRVLAADNITPKVMHMATGALKTYLDNKNKFVHSNVPQVGDIAVWEGHVGIVTGVDKKGNIKLTHARGKGKLASENYYFIPPQQYRNSKFYGYYRPIKENVNTEKTTSPGTVEATKTPEKTEDEKIYYGGTLPVVIVRPKTKEVANSSTGQTNTSGTGTTNTTGTGSTNASGTGTTNTNTNETKSNSQQNH